MEVVLGALIFFLTELYKRIIKLFGKEVSKNAIILIVFVLAFILAYLKSQNIISVEMINEIIKIGTIAIGIYEVIFKRILLPIFNKTN
jgi:hypothetical protein